MEKTREKQTGVYKKPRHWGVFCILGHVPHTEPRPRRSDTNLIQWASAVNHTWIPQLPRGTAVNCRAVRQQL
jgi:hypothetical protein